MGRQEMWRIMISLRVVWITRLQVIQRNFFKRTRDTVIAHICQFCDLGFASDRTFMSHLASAHYWERLKREYGSDVTRCPICHKVLSRPSATLHHIAEVQKSHNLHC